MARRPTGRGRKTANNLTPYQRRIARALAQGKTRQEARGHKAREHITRAEREKQRYGLTPNERQRVYRFAARQAERRNTDPDEAKAELLAWVQQNGFTRFEALQGEVKGLAKTHRVRLRGSRREGGRRIRFERPQGRSRNLDRMERQAERLKLPDYTWLFYH